MNKTDPDPLLQIMMFSEKVRFDDDGDNNTFPCSLQGSATASLVHVASVLVKRPGQCWYTAVCSKHQKVREKERKFQNRTWGENIIKSDRWDLRGVVLLWSPNVIRKLIHL